MPKSRVFWPVLLALVLVDCSTKQLAVEHLTPPHVPHELFGDAVRLTLAYNPGAAMSLSLGPYSRVGFGLLTVLSLVFLWRMYRGTRPDDLRLTTALALLSGGAVGNLLDRVRSPRGVVDFIDVGAGDVRFWTFNVADVGITLGAVALAVMLWRREEDGGSGQGEGQARGRKARC